MDVQVRSPVYYNVTFGVVPMLDAIATMDEAEGTLAIFAVNPSQDGRLPIEGDLRALAGYRVVEHLVLAHDDPKAANTADAPDTVVPHAGGDFGLDEGLLTATLPKLSWNVIQLAPAASNH